MSEKKKAIFIQARMSSDRFPGKMLKTLGGQTLIEYVWRRCAVSKSADVIAVITSIDDSDNSLADHCRSQGIEVHRGPLDNVLDRFISAADYYEADIVGRVCGDSPFVDIELLDDLFAAAEAQNLDFTAPDKSTCVAGLDSEVITAGALKRIRDASPSPDEEEHVTLLIRTRPTDFKVKLVNADLKPPALKEVRLTVDYPQDIVNCQNILDSLSGVNFPTSSAIIRLLEHDNVVINRF